MIPDAATVAQRWVNSAGAAQTRYTEGVQSTNVDPTALAVAQQQKLLTNFQQAVTNGRWSRALQRVGKAGWQQSTVAKAANYGTGISASQQKYAEAIAPVLAVEAQLQSQIQSMPKATLQDSINRMAAWATGLHNWAQSR
jgi:hypothetical protein